MSWKEEKGDLISRSALLKAMEEERQFLLARDQTGAEHVLVHNCLPLIDNAPTALFPLTVTINDNVTDKDIELLKRLMKNYNPQILNLELERPQGEYTEEDIKQAIKENFDIGYGMAKNKYKRQQGAWVKCQNDMFRCSNCGQADEVPTAMGKPIYNFCPNCGAKMKND